MAFEWLVVDKPITVIGAVSVRSGREDPVDVIVVSARRHVDESSRSEGVLLGSPIVIGS